ncbi:SDR family oxidoreductase [Fulvivirga maritima]|uniref:SDR family oxidoreductase n=1 Tax=Fulvivirga maritima TaxID=2904247 RepID=UPI001F2A80F5|nr:SDR family oxidoreductase [Fulvivirga maritima]UII24803.1 SDR family oxidoreductase [Fulvivirga maritima]
MSRTAIITGGTKGIGKSLVRLFASKGFNIGVCSRNLEELHVLKDEITKEFDVEMYVMRADLSDRAEVEYFVKYIKEHTKEVDVLINNAGLYIPGQVHNEKDGALESMIETNLYSAYHLTRGFIGAMKKRKVGHIFNMCSTASIMPYVNGGSYGISKFALLGMTKVLREEMKEFGVRVTAVMPGATLTASWEGTDLPESRFMDPDDVADTIWNAYEMSDRTVIEEILMRPQLGDI